jgi:hypothetical protein
MVLPSMWQPAVGFYAPTCTLICVSFRLVWHTMWGVAGCAVLSTGSVCILLARRSFACCFDPFSLKLLSTWH